MKLLTDVDIDTVGSSLDLGRMFRGSGDCTYAFYVWGTLGGGTVTLWISPDGGVNYFVARQVDGTSQASLNVADVIMVLLRGWKVRAVLTGSAGAADVNALLI